ncbi:MAG: MlaD family protein [Persicimonas sp.]
MKLENIVTPFKVGLLVLAAAAATVFMVVQLTGDTGFGQRDGYELHAYFDDVTGLAKRSRVMMSGVPIGEISSIELEDGRGRVGIRITDPEVTLYEGEEQNGRYINGASVAKKQASLIGDYYLEISPGAEGDELEDGDQIHNVIEAVGPEDLFQRFNEISADIEEVTESLSSVFGGPEGAERMDEMVADLAEVLNILNDFVGRNSVRLDRVVANADQISEDVRRFTEVSTESMQGMVQDASTIVEEVRFIIGQSSGDLQAGLGTLRGTLSRLQSTLDSLNYSLQNVQDITDKVNEGDGTVGELVNNPTIAQKSEKILSDAEEFTDRLTKLRTIVELRSEYHMQHAQLKNIAGLKLQPDDNKYYLLQLIDDYRGDTRVVREDVDTTRSDTDDPSYRETTVTTSDDFKFSAQLARGTELAPGVSVYGRFGIMESSGGLGGDLLLTEEEKLEFQADVFDFSLNRNPRVRAMGSYEFFEYVYIMGGVDDVLNPERRDYFLGVGLEFDDEDLKALLTTTGVPSP